MSELSEAFVRGNFEAEIFRPISFRTINSLQWDDQFFAHLNDRKIGYFDCNGYRFMECLVKKKQEMIENRKFYVWYVSSCVKKCSVDKVILGNGEAF